MRPKGGTRHTALAARLWRHCKRRTGQGGSRENPAPLPTCGTLLRVGRKDREWLDDTGYHQGFQRGQELGLLALPPFLGVG